MTIRKQYQTIKELRIFLKQEKAPKLFLDIETLRYNKIAKKPSDFKNKTYSVAISWWDEKRNPDTVYIYKSHNFDEFFFLLNDTSRTDGISRMTNITIYIHNGNKYDNHFLLHELKRNFELDKRANLYKKNSIDPHNVITKKDLKPFDYAVAESRVKSKNNLELVFKIKKATVTVTDTLPKTAESLKQVGLKLLKAGLIPEEFTKTEFDYTCFDIDADMTSAQIERHARQSFKSLTPKQHVYIDNDVIMLACLKKYFSIIYHGFDFNKATQTLNTLEHYKSAGLLATYQLTGKIGKSHFKLSDFYFSGHNLFNHIKMFYRGGLNFYNSQYIGKTIRGRFFSIDINSSYPASMYFGNIPTILHSYGTNQVPTSHTLDKSRYELFSVEPEFFNGMLKRIKSRIIREMLVKMFPVTSGYVRINTNTVRLIEFFSGGYTYTRLVVKDWLTYDTKRFGGKEVLADLYKDKTNGKSDVFIEFDEHMQGTRTELPPKEHFTDEQYQSFKTLLNGIYGAPALRAFYNRFEYDPESDTHTNRINGHKNTERNVLFSAFVTSLSTLNLLSPLASLSASEIDKYFIYADTDSLYLNYEIFHKINPAILNPIDLGKWDVEHSNITDMHVLNHKKYAYHTFEKGKHENHVRSGGINKSAFDLAMPFDDFIATQFHDGKEIKATRSILTKEQQICIYEGLIKMEKGSTYPDSLTPELDLRREILINDIRNEILNNPDEQDGDDALYFESNLGTFSISDVFPPDDIIEDKKPIQDYFEQQVNLGLVLSLI